MKKYLFLMFFLLLSISLLSQSQYSLSYHSLTNAGGNQANTNYSVTTVLGQKFQGRLENSEFVGHTGFLFPWLDTRVPLITSIEDIPADQGHQVQIIWNKCGYDDIYAIDCFYSIWRLDNNLGNQDFIIDDRISALKQKTDSNLSSQKNKSNLESVKSNAKVFNEPWQVITESRNNPDNQYFWQRDSEIWSFITEIPAIQQNEYSFVALTLTDSTAADLNYSVFKIIYHAEYEYYESESDSGYSVDNISPDETEVAITLAEEVINLHWQEITTGTMAGNSYKELNGIWYKIYAGDNPHFSCDESHLIETVTNLDYNYMLDGENRKFFKIVVSDQPPME